MTTMTTCLGATARPNTMKKHAPLRRSVRPRETKWHSRAEVAKRCFDADDNRLAVARLNRWIRADPNLREALEARGYRPRTRRLTPAVVRVLRRFFY